MKQTLKSVISFITISVFFIFSGCSKNADTVTNFTKTQLLTNSDWVQTGSQSKLTTESVWTDNFSSTPACSKDDRLVFRANGSFEINEGPTKCNSSNPQILLTGTWSFAQNETELVATIGGQNQTLTIETLTTTLLVIKYTDSYSGITREYKETYSH